MHHGSSNSVPDSDLVEDVWVAPGKVGDNELVLKQVLDHLIGYQSFVVYLVGADHRIAKRRQHLAHEMAQHLLGSRAFLGGLAKR